MLYQVRQISRSFKNTNKKGKWSKSCILVGGLCGAVVGVSLPLYIGLELSDFLDNSTNLNLTYSYASSTLLTAGIYAKLGKPIIENTTFVGLYAGAVLGELTYSSKKSLENIIKKIKTN